MGCAAPNPLHWEDLRLRKTEHVLGREGVTLAPDGHAYEVRFLDSLYRVDPIDESITEILPRPDRILTEEFQILLIRYLVAEYGGPLDGKEVSEKDLTGGVTFFQGPHALPTVPIARRYGRNPEAFADVGRKLGAIPQAHGDRSMCFFPFPLLPVTYVLWMEDEEFPASVSVLFDSSISRWFALDMVFTLVWVLAERILEA
ncbi:MAG: DUF3786 domain-containing protein [Pseudomonadota bacterium]